MRSRTFRVLSVIVACLPPASLEARQSFDCGFMSSGQVLRALRSGAARQEYSDPAGRAIPAIPERPRAGRAGGGGFPCLNSAHIFQFEDTNFLLQTNFSTGALLNLMTDAANAVMATHGDNFDFVGYWVNSPPHHRIGTAFYAQIENDISGIGDALYNNRSSLGLGGQNIEGYVMMWNVNDSTWQPGTSPNANFTRLALGQEFEHRFAMFLPNLLDGRRLQGNNGSCGREAHWSWSVDGQGSCMEIAEWVNRDLVGSFVTFNTDIGGVFSPTDLYLMGYLSPAEMDLMNSELRYMDTSNCSTPYGGVISTFSSADIVASAGPRIPDSIVEDHHYRTAWVMIHQPGDPPNTNELQKAVSILRQHQVDWSDGTLGRGSMNNSLFDDSSCGGPTIPSASPWTLGLLMILILGAGALLCLRRPA